MEILVPILLIAALIPILVPVGLILSQPPRKPNGSSLDFSALRPQVPAEQVIDLPTSTRPAPVRVWNWDQTDLPLAVVVHGSGWHGAGYTTLAANLARHGVRVAVPDMRGHGTHPERRGDVDYIGQMEDDLAALIRGAGADRAALVGHSAGGGLILRMAGGKHRELIARAVLIAPFMGARSTTFRAQAGGWAHPLIRRLTGMGMLKKLRISWFDGWTTLVLNPDPRMPAKSLAQMTTRYSARMMHNFAPHGNVARDIKALPDFMVIAGENDEAFLADKYQAEFEASSDKGTYVLMPDLGHLDIPSDEKAADRMAAFILGH